MARPSNLAFFVGVATAGSLTAAARKMDITTAAASKRSTESKYAQIASFDIAKSKACGSGVIVTVDLGQNREERFWVEGSEMTIGYSPWQVCPAR